MGGRDQRQNWEPYEPDIPAGLIVEWGHQIGDAAAVASQSAVVEQGEANVVQAQADRLHAEAADARGMADGMRAQADVHYTRAELLDRQSETTADGDQAAALRAEAEHSRDLADPLASSAERFDIRAADLQAQGDQNQAEADQLQMAAVDDEFLAMQLNKGTDSINRDITEIGDLTPGTISQVADLLNRIDPLPFDPGSETGPHGSQEFDPSGGDAAPDGGHGHGSSPDESGPPANYMDDQLHVDHC